MWCHFKRVFLEERSSQQCQNSWKRTRELKNTNCTNYTEVIGDPGDLLFLLQETWIKRQVGRDKMETL